MESGRHNQTNGNHKVGNVNVQIGDKEGIYAGSATNMARLFILCNVIWAMNMVYSDFHPLHKDDVKKYVEHAYLFLNDKDYSGKYSKEKWYAKKRA